MPFFSVIIPTYNRAILLQEALKSVFAQEYRDFEVLVVDDGSIDETEEKVRQFDSAIQFLRQQNRGPGAARNLGIQSARGAYVTFLDSDDLWFPWTLATFARIIQMEKEPSWIMGRSTKFVLPNDLTAVRQMGLKYTAYPDYFASSRNETWVPGCGVAIRRDILQEVGGFTDRWVNGEDSDLWLRLGVARKFIHLQAPNTLAYRCHPNTAVANTQRTLEGMQHLINQEKSGRYPGGPVRCLERLRILTRHTRPGSQEVGRAGRVRNAWEIYRDSFAWNARLGRCKYLVGFGLKLVSDLAGRSAAGKMTE
ncbi:MAG: glycosyltransferase family 2 protein [Opitutaceae bacterium]|nr:glycosyltransferase family 2 protein [Verrucomicrobiales bacterium]